MKAQMPTPPESTDDQRKTRLLPQRFSDFSWEPVPSDCPGRRCHFPSPPMGGKVGTHDSGVRSQVAEHRLGILPRMLPNILIVMLDDAGFGQASTFGGEIDTPTVSHDWPTKRYLL